ncbi:MAG: nuclear transport factor 2 family protein [Alphaproteobacteria bacterium]|nr:nuclear transport factor 2 family protein [Alphaproteobacteria bacterium]
MGKSENLDAYFEAVINGDGEALLESMSDSFVFDDPNFGQVPKSGMAAYFSRFKDTVATIRSDKPEAKLMIISDILPRDEGEVMIASCWWAVPGTQIQGAGLFRVGDDGVLSERLSYYTSLPD